MDHVRERAPLGERRVDSERLASRRVHPVDRQVSPDHDEAVVDARDDGGPLPLLGDHPLDIEVAVGPEPGGHLVELGRERAEFVGPPLRDGHVEVAGPDPLRRLPHPPDRTDDPSREEEGEREPNGERERAHEGHRPNGPLGYPAGPLARRHHRPLVEVAERDDGGISSPERREHPVFVELPGRREAVAGRAPRRRTAGLDEPGERGGVGRVGRVDRGDDGALARDRHVVLGTAEPPVEPALVRLELSHPLGLGTEDVEEDRAVLPFERVEHLLGRLDAPVVLAEDGVGGGTKTEKVRYGPGNDKPG